MPWWVGEDASGQGGGESGAVGDSDMKPNGDVTGDGDATTSRPLRIAYILRSYPRLSQTHILNEILGLERLGHGIRIFGMTPAREEVRHEGVAQVRARAEFLDAALRRSRWALLRDHLKVAATHPIRYARTAAYLARRPYHTAGYTTTSRYPCFAQAVYLAAHLNPREGEAGGVDHIHSHFAHDPTLVALLVSMLSGMTFSFTAHARDMLQIPQEALAERISHARAVVTICQANVDYLREVAPTGHGAKVRLVHTGIDVDAFSPARELRAASEVGGAASAGTQVGGAASAGPRVPRIVVVSRLVAKKGLLDLLEALGLVRAGGGAFECEILGDGPLREEISGAISRLSLEDSVELAGPATLAQVRLALQRADLYALTPFVTDDGDREGLPSSVLEAMACGVPVVSTRTAGIPEAVIHGDTGLLAEPRDVAGIAAQLITLLEDPELRRRMGASARARIVEQWGAESVARQLAAVFERVSDGRNSREEPHHA
jgi:glycosyltransferase involved in cell wall biosynthesis